MTFDTCVYMCLRTTHTPLPLDLQVDEAMARFEARLWERARDAQKLAQTDPAVLVDLARVVEMQEQVIHTVTHVLC
jgi:hypothetical protein